MALDETEVRKGLTGHLYMAPVGTTMPDDTTTALATVDADWVELGYISEDGLSMGVDNSTESHTPWQAFRAIRYDVIDRAEKYTFTLWQRNADTLKLAFGGGTVTDLGGGDRLYTPESSSNQYERAFVFEVIDGDIIDRHICYRGTPELTGDVPFNKTDITGFEIEVTVLETVDGSWKIVSNDESIDIDEGS